MSTHLWLAIQIANSSEEILRSVDGMTDGYWKNGEEFEQRPHIGVKPMLMALAMELALKAWYVKDKNTLKVLKTHNLGKLFKKLEPESQEHLRLVFKRDVATIHIEYSFVQDGLHQLLSDHSSSFVDWRYLHEKKHMMFQEGAMRTTLEMVLREFHAGLAEASNPTFHSAT